MDVSSYEQQGYNFKVYHFRLPKDCQDTLAWYGSDKARFVQNNVERFYRRGKNSFVPSEKGGMTICEVYNQEGQLLFDAVATCSLVDNYNYKLGRDIALGRALKVLSAERH